MVDSRVSWWPATRSAMDRLTRLLAFPLVSMLQGALVCPAAGPPCTRTDTRDLLVLYRLRPVPPRGGEGCPHVFRRVHCDTARGCPHSFVCSSGRQGGQTTRAVANSKPHRTIAFFSNQCRARGSFVVKFFSKETAGISRRDGRRTNTEAQRAPRPARRACITQGLCGSSGFLGLA